MVRGYNKVFILQPRGNKFCLTLSSGVVFIFVKTTEYGIMRISSFTFNRRIEIKMVSFCRTLLADPTRFKTGRSELKRSVYSISHKENCLQRNMGSYVFCWDSVSLTDAICFNGVEQCEKFPQHQGEALRFHSNLLDLYFFYFLFHLLSNENFFFNMFYWYFSQLDSSIYFEKYW